MHSDSYLLRDDYVKYIFYLIILFAFVSPYFTPLRTVGPEGILRLDQILMLIFVVFVIIRHKTQEICIDWTVILFFGMTTVITISFFHGLFYHQIPFRFGDTLNSIRWATYTVFIALGVTVLSSRMINLSGWLIILLGTVVSVVGILQALDVSGPITIVDSIYTPEHRAERSRRRANGTTINPNMLAQLLIIPLLSSVALLYRSIKQDLGQKYYLFISFSVTSLFVCMYFTYSRTGIIATVIGITAIFIVILFSKVGGSSHKIRKIITIGVVCALSAAFLLIIQFRRYGLTLAGDNSLQIRLAKWKDSIPTITDSLLLGYGPSRSKLPVRHIDSGILEWWFHHGLIGVIILLGLFVVIIWYSYSLSVDREKFNTEPIVWALSIAILGWTIAIPFVWIFLPVESYTRPFTVYLVCVSMIISSVIHN